MVKSKPSMTASSNRFQKGHPFEDGRDGVRALNPIALITGQTGATEAEATAMLNAVQRFTGNGYENIRAIERGEPPVYAVDPASDVAYYTDLSRSLNAYIDTAPKWDGGKTYRGIIDENGALYGSVKIGDVIDMGGTASWTSVEAKAIDRANKTDEVGIVFIVDSQRKYGTSTAALSQFPAEYEVTSSRRAQYEVLGLSNYPSGSIHHQRASEVKIIHVREV